MSYTLGANLENLTLSGNGSIDGTGNALDNVITGNSGSNTLNGVTGADTLIGGAGGDIYFVDNAGDQVIEAAGEGTDLVRSSISWTLGAFTENLLLTQTGNTNATGNSLGNVINGNIGDNILDGQGGADKMIGRAGDDIYIIDHSGDRAIEDSAANGNDTVLSSVTYTIGAFIDNLTLTGAAAINGTGNASDNVMTGNDANNVLNGVGGADVMIGGGGNDTYFADNSADQAIEEDGGGTDVVRSTASFALGGFIENLVLTGNASVDGTGNDLDNIIDGNGGANRIDGGGGADLMRGRGGDDIYVVDNAGDQIVEDGASGGIDKVESSIDFTLGSFVENLSLTGSSSIDGSGNTLANNISGNSADNVLAGLQGNDLLLGGSGDDELHGGTGIDTLQGGVGAGDFVFDSAPGASNVDFILDFTVGSDKIVLENSVFSTLSAGALGAGAFTIGTAASDADDRIVYDSASGALYYDADGSGAGAAVQIATLITSPDNLSATDFMVI